MTSNCVLVTGGSGKLGRVIVSDLAAAGWTVVFTTRNAATVASFTEELHQRQLDVHVLEVDFMVPEAVETLIAELRARALKVTHLVNNARSLDTLAVSDDGTTSPDHFQGEFHMDVVQPYRLTIQLAMAPDQALRNVVNIGSQYGIVAPNPALYEGSLKASPIQYGVSKAALHHLTRELSVRLAPQVRVNCVAYGGFEGRTDSAFLARYAALSPNQRMLKDHEAAGPVAFLLGEESSSVNGHVLVADGGWSIW